MSTGDSRSSYVEEVITESTTFDSHPLVLLFRQLNLEMQAAESSDGPPISYKDFLAIVSCLGSTFRQLKVAIPDITHVCRTSAAAADE